uniref:Uncharacterized protein n=1 Tax=Strigops habroptila TaxID=2489341 RepID=A0A672TZT9_STRHB
AASPRWEGRLWHVLHGQHLLAQGSRHIGCHRSPAALGAGDALAAGTAGDAELQVLLLREGSRHLLGCPDGEGELAAGLAHRDGGADVFRTDLHVPPTVLKGSREVAYLSLIDLLVDALLHVLEYDGELPCVQPGLEHCQGWGSHSSSGPPVSMFPAFLNS